MSDSDKNLHLSPLLDKIRDYGPGEEPGEDSAEGSLEGSPEGSGQASAETREEQHAELSIEVTAAAPPDEDTVDAAMDSPADEPPPAPPPAAAPAPPPAKSSKLALYSLIGLWLLTLAGGFGAFVWQQTRIDALALELRDERGKGRDLVAAAEREAARLADRVVELDDTIAGLQMALSDAENEAASLAIASVDAAPSEQPPQPVSVEAPAPEMAPEVAEAAAGEAAAEPIAAAVPEPAAPEPAAAEPAAPQPAAAEQQVAPAVTADAPTGPWYINLSTMSSRAAAENWLASLGGAPERAEIIAVQSGGKTLYRVRVGGYATREDAVGLAERLGVSSAWASKG